MGTVFCSMLFSPGASAQKKTPQVLNASIMKNDIDYFNSLDKEDVRNFVSNAATYEWLSDQIPLFECPDSAIQKIYYYRWWTLRKHLKQTPEGYIFTEFITPMKHGGKYNAISSALGLQVNEARWLHNQEFVQKYVTFWLDEDKATTKPHFHNFSSWVDDAVYNLYLVNGDKEFLRQHISALSLDYQLWEKERQLPNQMFWQFDVKDAMEESISGSRKEKNIRPTINSYMYGNAAALSKIAAVVGADSIQKTYEDKAAILKKLVMEQLWDEQASFFKVRKEKGGFADAREAIGLIPWYFNLPPDKNTYAVAWDQLIDTAGFTAPWGLTTAERRHPLFRTHGSGHGCEWDGAVWPYATTQSLKALSNLLNNYKSHGKMNPTVFYNEFHKYALSHIMDGKTYIGEYQDEKNGEWLKGDHPRSRFYNHSSFTDLVINDLVGLKPAEDNTLEIRPLIPAGQWEWFCLDNVWYHGHAVTVLWDKTGKKYGKGKGLRVYVDGIEKGSSKKLKPLKTKLI
ncbi:MGH1-like glycoside hydrolase domain-containing protein [Pedobacter sp. AW31-3R]|uniref:MGH1-like glycoside hydrolase domain-containing protein n=1 Tax=Pedobacter sp. AW31-3R TaxID=3445781 RepID=UPI003F9F3D8B